MREARVEKKRNAYAGQRGRAFEFLDRHWRWCLLLFWLVDRRLHALATAGARSASSRSATPTTICGSCRSAPCSSGQGWYDLAQHRLAGSNIHWSRLVDLPIAGLKLAVHALLRRADRRADRGRGGAAAADAGGDGGDRVVVRRLVAPHRLAARHRPARLRRLGQRHVAAAQDRPSWLAARHARLGDGLADRPEAGARRRHARRRHRAVASRSAWRCCPISPSAGAIVVLMWVRDGGEARRLAAYGDQPRRRLRLRLPRLHLRGEHGAALRRADAGLAVGDARRRRDRGRARLC